MAYQEQLRLDTLPAERSLEALEREAREAFTNLQLDIDTTSLTRLRSALNDLRANVVIDQSDIGRIQAQIRNIDADIPVEIDNLDRLLNDLQSSVGAADQLQDQMALFDRELGEAAVHADRLDDELSGAARAATTIAGANVGGLGTGLATANVSAGGLAANFALLASNAAALSGARIPEGTITAATGVAEAVSRLRLTATSGDIERGFQRTFGALRSGADAARTGISTLEGSVRSLGPVLQGLGIGAGIIGIGTAIRIAASAVTESVGQFSALNESVNAVNVTFEEGAPLIERFGDISAKSAGLSRQSFQQLVVPIGAVLRNFGLDANTAADASINLVQRAADLASVFNTDVEDALLAINSALVGQVEPLRKYGAEISIARTEQLALASGMAATKAELTDQDKIMARLQLIFSDTSRVQGDFVNTSDEFANATRTARAEMEELAATAGEGFVPAFEDLLALAPQVTDALRAFIPVATDAAQAGAGAVQSMLDILGGGIANDVAAFTGGFGILGDAIGGVGDIAGVVFNSVATNVKGADVQLDQFSQRLARNSLRVASVSLLGDLEKGQDVITALGNALQFLGRDSENLTTFEEGIARLGTQSGITAEDAAVLFEFLVELGPAAGFSVGEVNLLERALAVARSEINLDIEAVRQLNSEMRGDFAGPTLSAPPRFASFANETGAAIIEARSTIQTELRGLITDTEGNAAAFDASLDLFAKAPEKIETSAAQAVENLRKQVEETAAFEANIARLGALGFDQLAANLLAEGPAAARQVGQFLKDLDLAAEAESLFDGVATPAITALTEDLIAELVGLGLDPRVAATLAASLSNPQVKAALAQAGLSAASETTSAYGRGLETTVADLGSNVDSSRFTNFVTEVLVQDEAAGEAAIANMNAWEAGMADEATATGGRSTVSTAAGAAVSLSLDARDEAYAAGQTTAGGYQDGIIAELAALDVLAVGAAAIAALGISLNGYDEAYDAGVNTARGYEDGLRDKFEIQSPSKVMMRIGAQVADDFINAINGRLESGISVTAPISGNLSGGAAAPAGATSDFPNVSLTVVGGEDVTRNAAKAAQQAAIIGSMLTVVRR